MMPQQHQKVTLQFGASLLMTLAKAKIVNYDLNCFFIVLATVITIVNYDCHLFIVRTTEASLACQGPPLVAPEWQGQLQKG